MEKIIEIKSKRGQTAIAYNGFRYTKHAEYKSSNNIVWRCSLNGCKGKLHTDSNRRNATERGSHNHLPNNGDIAATVALDSMKLRAKAEALPIPVIYKQESARSAAAASATSSSNPNIPSFQSIKTQLYCARRRKFPTLPKSVQELSIPEHLRNTKNGEAFLLGSNTEKGFIVFATEDNLRRLCSNQEHYMDGTFDVAPPIFKQLFTIHTFVQDKQFPEAYALLPDKTTMTYVALFRQLRDEAARRDLIFNPLVCALKPNKPLCTLV